MLEQLLKPSTKRPNDPQDANDGEDDDEFKKIFNDPRSVRQASRASGVGPQASFAEY